MKAYRIDPFNREITEVEYSGDFEQIYTLTDCQTFTCVEMNEFGDTVYVDDEGLINGKPQEFFYISGYPEPLAGYGLILGTDSEGESVEPSITIDQARARIDWISAADLFLKYA